MPDFHCTSCGFDFEEQAPEKALDWKPRCSRCLRVSGVEPRVAVAPKKVGKKPRFLRIWLILVSLTLVVGMVIGVAATDTSEQAEAVGEAAGGAIALLSLACFVAWVSWRINRIGERKARPRRPPEKS